VQAIELLAADPARVSDPVSAILVPDGHDANALRKVALESFNLSLGGGLGPLAGPVFRTGRTSDLNEAMLLGALATWLIPLTQVYLYVVVASDRKRDLGSLSGRAAPCPVAFLPRDLRPRGARLIVSAHPFEDCLV
jgi:hypothetical protein